MSLERRRAKRFELPCLVTVSVRRARAGWSSQGNLCDIGEFGARFRLAAPLAVGTRLGLDVHFVNRNRGITTIHFGAIVVRAQQESPYETAVQFRTSARFLRDGPKTLVAGSGHSGSGH